MIRFIFTYMHSTIRAGVEWQLAMDNDLSLQTGGTEDKVLQKVRSAGHVTKNNANNEA